MNTASICFLIGIGIPVIVALYMLAYRIISKSWVTRGVYKLMGCCFVCFAVLQIPIVGELYGQIRYPVEKLTYSLLESLRIFTMNSEYRLNTLFNEIDPLLTVGNWDVYRFAIALAYLIAPILTITTVLSLLKLALRKVFFHLNFLKDTYIFSELNEKSFTTAKSIYEKRKGHFFRPYIVFCKQNINDNDPDTNAYRYQSKARSIGALLLDHAITDCDYSWCRFRHRNLSLFLITEEETESIQDAIEITNKLLAEKRAKKYYPYPLDEKRSRVRKAVAIKAPHIYLFSTEAYSEPIVDGILEQVEQREAKLSGKYIPFYLHLIDPAKFIAQDLLLHYPLYKDLKTEEPISVAVVGCGRFGMEIAKAAMITGVMNSHKLKVRILDKNADAIKKEFDHCYPSFDRYFSLKNISYSEFICSVDVQFVTCNVADSTFDDALNDCKDANYIVVATGDDALTYETAAFLWRWNLRNIRLGESKSINRKIYAMIRNDGNMNTFNNFKSVSKFEENYGLNNVRTTDGQPNIVLFGGNEWIYGIDCLKDRFLDQLGAAYNYAYNYDNNQIIAPFYGDPSSDQEKMITEFYGQSTVNQNSSRFAALHGFYKLRDLDCLPDGEDQKGGQSGEKSKSENVEPENLKAELETKMMKLKNNLKMLQETEHNRWSVAQVLAGYDTYPISKLGESHKNDYARLHGCIIPNDRLEELGQKLRNGKEKFIRYDTQMCAMCLYGLRERGIKSWKCKFPKGKRNSNPWSYPKTSIEYETFADDINQMANKKENEDGDNV